MAHVWRNYDIMCDVYVAMITSHLRTLNQIVTVNDTAERHVGMNKQKLK